MNIDNSGRRAFIRNIGALSAFGLASRFDLLNLVAEAHGQAANDYKALVCLFMFGGNDGIRDTWTPYAKPDMLDRAMHIGLRNALRHDDELGWALDCVTDQAARGCGFANYGLAPGDRADLVLVTAETVAEAVVAAPPRRFVVAGGRIVARDGELTM